MSNAVLWVIASGIWYLSVASERGYPTWVNIFISGACMGAAIGDYVFRIAGILIK